MASQYWSESNHNFYKNLIITFGIMHMVALSFIQVLSILVRSDMFSAWRNEMLSDPTECVASAKREMAHRSRRTESITFRWEGVVSAAICCIETQSANYQSPPFCDIWNWNREIKGMKKQIRVVANHVTYDLSMVRCGITKLGSSNDRFCDFSRLPTKSPYIYCSKFQAWCTRCSRFMMHFVSKCWCF